MKNRWFPFGILPGAWGLRGKSREEAKINYYYDGVEREIKLAELNSTDSITKELNKQQYEEKKLEIQFKYGKISKDDYERDLANLKGEPWVSAKESHFNGEEGVNGFYLKFNWNEHFINLLMSHGYSGYTDEEIVEKWYNDLNKSILEEMIEAEALSEDIPFEERIFESADLNKKFPRYGRVNPSHITRRNRSGNQSEYS
jgi:hypothetical protein